MTPEEFAKRMTECDSDDTESSHCSADALMCEVLEQLGYEVGVKIFLNMKKWYA